MRLRLEDGDDGGLGPTFLTRAEPGIHRKTALRAITGNDKSGVAAVAVAILQDQLQHRAFAQMLPGRNGTLLEDVNLPVLCRRQERGMKGSIADDIAHRHIVGLPAELEGRPAACRKAAWRRPFGDGEPADRCRCHGEPVPDTERCQHAGAGGIDGCRSLVCRNAVTAAPVDENDPVAGVRERGRRHKAGQPAPDDRDVMHQHLHGR